jgi:hypothetical protein
MGKPVLPVTAAGALRGERWAGCAGKFAGGIRAPAPLREGCARPQVRAWKAIPGTTPSRPRRKRSRRRQTVLGARTARTARKAVAEPPDPISRHASSRGSRLPCTCSGTAIPHPYHPSAARSHGRPQVAGTAPRIISSWIPARCRRCGQQRNHARDAHASRFPADGKAGAGPFLPLRNARRGQRAGQETSPRGGEDGPHRAVSRRCPRRRAWHRLAARGNSPPSQCA